MSDLGWPGEEVWDEAHAKILRLQLDSDVGSEIASLGRADRPSEVARLLREAADQVDQAAGQ